MITSSNVFKKYASIIVVLFMFMAIDAIAQKPILLEDFSRSVGEKYKRIKSLATYNIAKGDRFLSIKKGRTDMTIQRFSLKDLKENIKQRQIIEDKGNFQTAMELGGKAAVFYTIKDKAYAQLISLTGFIAEKPELIGSDKENINSDFGFKSTYGFDAGGRINKFGFKKSFDGTKLLVVFRVQTGGDKPDKIGISVYDDALKPLWKRKVTMPYASDRMENEDFAIDNDGNFYMTASIFNSKDAKKDKLEGTYKTEVFKIMNDPKDIVQEELSIAGKSITHAVIGVTPEGKVQVTGIYANNDNKAETSGVFTAALDNAGKVTMKHSDISEATLTDLATKRESRINEGTQDSKDLKDLEKLKINEVIYNPDQSTVVFAEQRYVEAFTTSSSSGSRTTYKFYYRDIWVFKLAADGSMSWMHKLPKHQIGARGKRSMSYKHLRHQGKHYLFYIDNFVNLKRSFDEYSAKYFDGKKDFNYLTAYVINDGTGEVVKEPILTGSDIRNARLDVMNLSKAVTLPNKDMIYEIFDGKKNNLLFRLSLKK